MDNIDIFIDKLADKMFYGNFISSGLLIIIGIILLIIKSSKKPGSICIGIGVLVAISTAIQLLNK